MLYFALSFLGTLGYILNEKSEESCDLLADFREWSVNIYV